MKTQIAILFSLILCFAFTSYGQEQKIKKCAVPKGIDGKYKLVSESQLLTQHKEVLLNIVIKPKNFTREYLIEFAKRVRAEYCNEEFVGVQIFDNKKAVMSAHYDYVTSGGKIDRRRGTYLLDRKTGEEGVEFSTKAGNPINEVRIELKYSLK